MPDELRTYGVSGMPGCPRRCRELGGQAMAYRGFDRPTFSRGSHSTTDWMTWLAESRAIPSVAGRVDGTCDLCFGAVKLDPGGDPYRRCFNCRSYQDYVDALISAVYSLDSGLESMLHRFKDWQGYAWLAGAFGSLLHSFWSAHAACIYSAHGNLDLLVPVPSNNAGRAFDHLASLNTSLSSGPILPLVHGILTRRQEVPRPMRGQLAPEAFAVTDPDAVADANVLLFDDTWTSGSSTASAAASLKRSGAASVVVLTLGRQLNVTNAYGTSEEIATQVIERGWTGKCVLCV